MLGHVPRLKNSDVPLCRKAVSFTQTTNLSRRAVPPAQGTTSLTTVEVISLNQESYYSTEHTVQLHQRLTLCSYRLIYKRLKPLVCGDFLQTDRRADIFSKLEAHFEAAGV